LRWFSSTLVVLSANSDATALRKEWNTILRLNASRTYFLVIRLEFCESRFDFINPSVRTIHARRIREGMPGDIPMEQLISLGIYTKIALLFTEDHVDRLSSLDN
jgi:hypothetical protein